MAKPTSVVETSPEVEAREPEKKSSFPSSGPLNWADERTGLAKIGRFGLRKIFPDHWSFLLGEVALYFGRDCAPAAAPAPEENGERLR